MSKTSIFLTKHRIIVPRAGAEGGMRTYYTVIKLVNRLQPEVGSELSENEVEALVVGDSTVTITGSKTGR